MMSLNLGTALIAILGGLASFFSPCVAPLAPGYVSYISSLTTNQTSAGALATTAGVNQLRSAAPSLQTWRERLRGPATAATLLFVAGFSVTFMLFGLLA